ETTKIGVCPLCNFTYVSFMHFSSHLTFAHESIENFLRNIGCSICSFSVPSEIDREKRECLFKHHMASHQCTNDTSVTGTPKSVACSTELNEATKTPGDALLEDMPSQDSITGTVAINTIGLTTVKILGYKCPICLSLFQSASEHLDHSTTCQLQFKAIVSLNTAYDFLSRCRICGLNLHNYEDMAKHYTIEHTCFASETLFRAVDLYNK
ncbi:unnamed protein product, partial [Owenia fusiformis]